MHRTAWCNCWIRQQTCLCFFLSNEQLTNAQAGAYGFARQTFNSLGDDELLYELTGSVGIYAAAAAYGIYYAVPYHFTSSMQEPTPLPLFSYNLYTGHVEEIGKWNTDGSSFKPSDMTYDMKHDRLRHYPEFCVNEKNGIQI